MSNENLRLIPPPDRRYLRRGGNRRVRKVRLIRSTLRAWKTVLANLAAAAVLILAGVQAFRHVASSPAFALNEVQVEGTRRTTPEAVRARLGTFLGRNLLQIPLDRVAARLGEDPFISSVSVKRILPSTLRVTVTERVPAALAIVQGQVQVVDDSGVIMGPIGPGLAEDLPVLTGIERQQGEALRASLLRGVKVVERLKGTTGAWTDEISEVDLSRADRIGVVTRDPGPVIWLDPERVERNVDPYLAMRKEIQAKLGPVEYVDLRWRDRISVLPSVDTQLESD